MVTIKSYQKRESKEGKEFIAPELVGKVEAVQSSQSGKFYLTQKRCFLSSTFDEQTAASLIGTKMSGEIVRIESEPYDFTLKTGEVITIQHSYGYVPTLEAQVVGTTPVMELA